MGEKTEMIYTHTAPTIQVVVMNVEKIFSEKELTVGECRVVLNILKNNLEKRIMNTIVDFDK